MFVRLKQKCQFWLEFWLLIYIFLLFMSYDIFLIIMTNFIIMTQFVIIMILLWLSSRFFFPHVQYVRDALLSERPSTNFQNHASPLSSGVLYLEACSRRPCGPSCLMLPRIPLARHLPHIHEWSHCSCCEVPPPVAVLETQIWVRFQSWHFLTMQNVFLFIFLIPKLLNASVCSELNFIVPSINV